MHSEDPREKPYERTRRSRNTGWSPDAIQKKHSRSEKLKRNFCFCALCNECMKTRSFCRNVHFHTFLHERFAIRVAFLLQLFLKTNVIIAKIFSPNVNITKNHLVFRKSEVRKPNFRVDHWLTTGWPPIDRALTIVDHRLTVIDRRSVCGYIILIIANGPKWSIFALQTCICSFLVVNSGQKLTSNWPPIDR